MFLTERALIHNTSIQQIHTKGETEQEKNSSIFEKQYRISKNSIEVKGSPQE